uniref:Cytochrome P450 n=1 Tax=Propylea japonica TaxID=158624 RepID=A0A5J6XYL2_9CUCU|nr:cytochrome P450 [Propylea japonica]QKI86660.1 cytochrome P450 [Propylea japonica]
MLILTLGILACTIWLIKFFREKLMMFLKASNIPNVKTGRFGAIGDLVGKSVDGCLKQILHYMNDGPEIQKTWFGHYLMVGVMKPEYVEAVMTNKNSLYRTPLMNFLSPYVGDGIFTAKGTAFGARMKAQSSKIRYGEYVSDFLDLATVRMMNPFYHPQILFYMTKIGKMSKKISTELRLFAENLITQQRSVFEQNIQRGQQNDNKDDDKYKTVMEMLLEEIDKERGFTEEQLADEVNTLLAAGTDTTAVVLSYCCLTLGMYPEYQQKIYEEVVEVLGDRSDVTQEDVSKMHFVEMFIKETLRIFPIAPLNVRMADDDVILDENYVIPKGTLIIMSALHMQRSPKYWKDPLKFDPYRFLPERFSEKHPFSYIPFSRGPRNCLGARYAMMNLKIVFSKIVRKFTVKTDYRCLEDVVVTVKLLSAPTDGFKITLYQRK